MALPPNKVKELALEEHCELVFFSMACNRATFTKLDRACNNFVIINVYCDEATVGISLDHPRQGKMQTFRRGVDLSEMREIFLNPRQCAGYPGLNRPSPEALSDFDVGDRVRVKWGTSETIATLTELGDHPNDTVRVRQYQ